jgi:hypothetical protein
MLIGTSQWVQTHKEQGSHVISNDFVDRWPFVQDSDFVERKYKEIRDQRYSLNDVIVLLKGNWPSVAEIRAGAARELLAHLDGPTRAEITIVKLRTQQQHITQFSGVFRFVKQKLIRSKNEALNWIVCEKTTIIFNQTARIRR